ncbi:glycosyltransferase family 1 protein [Sporolactobacillus sp. THM7-7]|nr:glycosyltransferase family 1 protein [Sporolactobacillus sp. THM7-7]
MKLAFICTEKLPSPAVRGGAIQILIDGVAPLLTEKHELTIFSITDPTLPDREIRNKVHYIRFPRESYSDHIAEELVHHNFDVIHVFNRPKDVVKYKNTVPDCPFVLSLHNDMFTSDKISTELGKDAIHSVERIMTVSHYVKNTIIKRFPDAATKIRVVYSGVDLDRYTPAWTGKGRAIRARLRREYGIEGKKVVLFVGRLSRKKGPHLLIKAMKSIIEYDPDIVLVIVGSKWFGDNSVNHYVRYLYKLTAPMQRHILFTNYVPPERIPELYLIADVFVCSSQWQEPLARVHYEAMAAGIPIITTNRGGNGEIIKHMHNGFVIKNFNRVSAYVDAIEFLLANSDTAEVLAQNGRSVVETNYQFRHVARNLEEVYHDAFRHSRNRIPFTCKAGAMVANRVRTNG